MHQEKLLLDLGEVAELFGVCPRSVATWEKQRRIPQALRIGRNLRWHRANLLKWLEERAASQIEEVAQ